MPKILLEHFEYSYCSAVSRTKIPSAGTGYNDKVEERQRGKVVEAMGARDLERSHFQTGTIPQIVIVIFAYLESLFSTESPSRDDDHFCFAYRGAWRALWRVLVSGSGVPKSGEPQFRRSS